MVEDISTNAAPRRRFVPLFERRYTLELRQQLGWPQQAAILAASVALGLLICGAILVTAGVSPGQIGRAHV